MFSNIHFSDLAKWLGAPAPQADFKVANISTDSRTLKKGDVFLAIKGETFDGNQFIDSAVIAGASGLIVEQGGSDKVPTLIVPDGLKAFAKIGKQLRARFKGPVFAITGSAGKSSTKEMVGTLLGDKAVRSPASFNNLLGVSKTLCLVEDDTEELVLEMGMNNFGEIRELCETFSPHFGTITNIGDAHVGKLGGREGVRRAKKELFDYLATQPNASIALNFDDEAVLQSYAEAWPTKKPKTITYSLQKPDADVYVTNVRMNPEDGRLNLLVRVGKETSEVSLPIFGLHHAQNLAAAIATCKLAGHGLEDLKPAFAQLQPAKHRGEVKKLKNGSILIDECYNSNPTALKSSLTSLMSMNAKLSHLLLLGEMRELEGLSDDLHREVGEHLIKLYKNDSRDWCFVGVGEKMKLVHEQVKKSGGKATWFANVADLKKQLPTLLKPNQVVLVKGSRGIQLDLVLTDLLASPAA